MKLIQNVKMQDYNIFGATNDQEYAKECLGIIKNLGLEDCVKVYGQINPMDYMPKMDFTILTSISEGQPLTILESFAARRPVVCTNVGCCKELINGNRDGIGKAGICCTPMDISGIAKAMSKLCQNKELRMEFGENGLQRVKKCYKYEKMMDSYFELYEKGVKKLAGIGFELNNLINKKSFFSKVSGYFYTTSSCLGSMILGFVLLFSIQAMAKALGQDDIISQRFTGYITNTVFLSMIIFGAFSLVLSRYIFRYDIQQKRKSNITIFLGSNICNYSIISNNIYTNIGYFSN